MQVQLFLPAYCSPTPPTCPAIGSLFLEPGLHLSAVEVLL